MNSLVLIAGEGVLADCVSHELSAHYPIIRKPNLGEDIPNDTDLVLLLDDNWKPAVHKKAEEVLRKNGTPWLRGFVSFGEGIVGPLVRPGESGCSQCADMRLLMGSRDRVEMVEVQQRLDLDRGMESDPWASRTGLLQMAYLISVQVQHVLRGDQVYSEGKVYSVDLKTLKGSWHSILPNPLCPVCGQLPDDAKDLAQVSLQSSPKISSSSFRVRRLDEIKESIVNDYLDNRTGVLNSKMYDLVTPFADASVNLPMMEGDEATGGRSHSYEESVLTAILEGVERYCGIKPRGKRTVVHDRYRNLENQALHPLRVGVHAKEQYTKPGFPFKSFDPDRSINWVWGYSLLEERPILVPERLAYYSVGHGTEGFVYETSNGCALGGSLEEAIFYGMMEVLERDSFLMTWYAKLNLPRLDPFTADDRELELMVERMRAVAGYDLYLYDATMEHGIPSIFAIAKNRKEKGLNLICAAGAHLDPVRAVKGAIQELAGMMLNLDKNFEANKAEYEKMLYDSSLVTQMDHHGMLYGLPQAEERLSFLLDNNSPMRTFNEAFNWKSNHTDLTGDLQDILQVFRRLNLEVIVVDQSSPETLRNGLYCVKVLIPGMLPMTFGHHLTRLTGLERVLRVPMELNFTTEPLTIEQLNPYPHPFP